MPLAALMRQLINASKEVINKGDFTCDINTLRIGHATVLQFTKASLMKLRCLNPAVFTMQHTAGPKEQLVVPPIKRDWRPNLQFKMKFFAEAHNFSLATFQHESFPT